MFREVGPVPNGAAADSGGIGRAVTMTLSRRGYDTGVGVIPSPRGNIVYHLYEQVRDYTPTFEQALPLLQARLQEQRTLEYERQARELFERDPARFATGNVLHFSRVICEPMQHVHVPLTRNEIERHYRAHIEKYSTPEQVQARHILISPTGTGPEADAAARRKAEDLLRRVRAGEDFAVLANQYSDDPPTRNQGGDLGYFSRGAMLEPVERAAFALKAGEVSEVVKSEVGYHVIKVTDHVEMVSEPLKAIYTLVGLDAADEKADRVARARADSISKVVKTPAQAIAAARKLKLAVAHYQHSIGDRSYPANQHEMFSKLEQLEPGKLYPGAVTVKGIGSFIQWPDSVTPATTPKWETARPRVLEAYVREAGERAFEAKRAELDSLGRAGWSLDSVAALWGGLEQAKQVRPGAGLRGLAPAPVIDSLVFGGRRAAALDEGEATGWLELPDATMRLRLKRRHEPDPSRLATLTQAERRLGLERNLQVYFEELKRRYPVRILDRELRDTSLPELPKSASLQK
jgi:parvulin-like peptidyl-prolyl isomerase